MTSQGVHVLIERLALRQGPLRSSLSLLAATGTTLAALEIALSVRSATEHMVLAASLPASGAGFVLVGALAWSRRPSNRTGLLLCVTGLLILMAALADVGLPDPWARIGVLLAETPIAAALLVVLAFPSGRVATRFDRGLVLALTVAVLVRQLPVVLPGPDLEALRTACSLVGAAILVLAVVRLARRVRAAPSGTGERWVLSVVYGYGMAFLLFLPFSARVLTPLLALDATTLGVVQATGLAVLPFVFAAGVLRGGFARTGELDDLAAWLGSRGAVDESLPDLLASVLGDPSLEVLFSRPVSGRLIDGDGRAASLDLAADRGAVRVLGRDGADAGVTLTYDRTLFGDPSLVEQAGRVLAARVVDVADGQRRQLAQDLHDVLQSRLTLAALHAGRSLRRRPTSTRGRTWTGCAASSTC